MTHGCAMQCGVQVARLGGGGHMQAELASPFIGRLGCRRTYDHPLVGLRGTAFGCKLEGTAHALRQGSGHNLAERAGGRAQCGAGDMNQMRASEVRVVVAAACSCFFMYSMALDISLLCIYGVSTCFVFLMFALPFTMCVYVLFAVHEFCMLLGGFVIVFVWVFHGFLHVPLCLFYVSS